MNEKKKKQKMKGKRDKLFNENNTEKETWKREKNNKERETLRDQEIVHTLKDGERKILKKLPEFLQKY